MNDDEIQLQNVDPDDVDDAIVEIQRTFRLKFAQDDFAHVKTFGEFCDAVLLKITLPHQDGCTSQQAFYKLREAIIQMSIAERNLVTPTSKLDDLFPHKGRRAAVRQLEHRLGLDINILTSTPLINNLLAATYLLSVVLFFFNWQFSIACFCFTVACNRLALYLGREFKVNTLGEVTERIMKQDYFNAKRNPQTVNRREVHGLVKKVFMEALFLPERALAEDAVFN